MRKLLYRMGKRSKKNPVEQAASSVRTQTGRRSEGRGWFHIFHHYDTKQTNQRQINAGELA